MGGAVGGIGWGWDGCLCGVADVVGVVAVVVWSPFLPQEGVGGWKASCPFKGLAGRSDFLWAPKGGKRLYCDIV